MFYIFLTNQEVVQVDADEVEIVHLGILNILKKGKFVAAFSDRHWVGVVKKDAMDYKGPISGIDNVKF